MMVISLLQTGFICYLIACAIAHKDTVSNITTERDILRASRNKAERERDEAKYKYSSLVPKYNRLSDKLRNLDKMTAYSEPVNVTKIKRALSKEFHPDKGGSVDVMQKINKVLSEVK